MKSLKYLFIFLLMSCSSAKVMTDYDSEVNFNEFKTFAFFEDAGKGLSELDVKRVLPTISNTLKEMNLNEVENPDFFINVITKTNKVQSNNTIGIGIGSSGRSGGFGVSGGIPIGGNKLNEAFIIEFVDAKTNLVIWEGILNSKVNEKRKPEEKEVHFKEIIEKVLNKYPPIKN